MKTISQPRLITQSMSARISLILKLVLSLLFVTQAQSVTLPAEMQQGSACAGMQCSRRCCTNTACCDATEQQTAPQTPTPPPRSTQVPLAMIGLRTCTILFIPPAPRRPFVILDETSTAHALSPLAANCIRLI